MKAKKLKISISLICLAILIGLIAWAIQSIAVDRTINYQIKIVNMRKDSNLGYRMLRTGAVTDQWIKIWNIVKMNGATAEELPLYCVQAELGFMQNGRTEAVTYNQAYDMKLIADKTELNTNYGSSQLIIAKNESADIYSRVLWLADHMYVPAESSRADKIQFLRNTQVINSSGTHNEYTRADKDNILVAAGIITEAEKSTLSAAEKDELFYSEWFLSDDVIEVVQQLAYWYIIHSSESDALYAKYHKETLPDLYVASNEEWTGEVLLRNYGTTISVAREGKGPAYNINTKIGQEYQRNAAVLYSYLITQANSINNSYYESVKYDTPASSRVPIKVNSESGTVAIEENGNNYIVGPYEIERTATGEFELQTQISISNHKVLNSEKSEVANVKSVIGNEVGTYQFYLSVPKTEDVSSLSVSFDVTSDNRVVKLLLGADATNEQPILLIERNPAVYNKVVENKPFDLALRKVITGLTDKDGTSKLLVNLKKEGNERTLDINTDNLYKVVDGKLVTTATYNHRKDPVLVEPGDIVTYTITIFNEGKVAGRATKVMDVLPDGLEFVEIVSGDYKVARTIGESRIVFEKKSETNLNGFNGTNLESEPIVIKCRVTANASVEQQILTNIALIVEEYNADTDKLITNQVGWDVDSEPSTCPTEITTRKMENYKGHETNPGNLSRADYFYKGQQDDDDFEKLVIKGENFDLSLRKYITEVETKKDNGTEKLKYDREPKVDVSKLNTFDGNGNLITTSEYNHTKTPVSVKIGDVVTYTIRVYNEGDIDGYVSEITDYLPKWLEFLPEDKLNIQYLWKYKKEGNTRIITTEITSKGNASGEVLYGKKEQKTYRKNGKLLKAYNADNMETLDYIDVKVRCKVIGQVEKEKLASKEKITNIAVITKMTDASGKEIKTDRDSTVDYKNLPSDKNLPSYKDKEIKSGKKYIPGQEDDDDFEKLIVQDIFDLALRKFITEVEGTEVNNRYPVVKEGTNGRDFNYEHTKKPVEVVSGNTVVYTIRVFNEGSTAGYASEVMDDLPEGIIFLPEHDTNIEYRWVMYKEAPKGSTADYEYAGKKYVKTDKAEEAKIIVTDYLDKEVSEEDGRDSLLKAYDKKQGIKDGNPDYRDLKVAFKVTEPNSSKRIIVNTAEITRDEDKDGNEVTDKDSTPGNGVEKEDDIDKEYIKVKEFDLALLKWVSQVSVTQDGKTTVTNTGHTVETARDEDPVLVTIDSKKINSVVVKFIYDIRVENQGEIEGYAKEIKDHIPDGLVFKAEDNPDWEQIDEKTITTDKLKDTLLKPGETASVRVVLTWVNGTKNLNLKVNYAEISKDYNEWGVPDKDSTPDNWTTTPGEDDDDDAPVLLILKTGQMPVYFVLGTAILATLAGGIYLIKKYVYNQ